jgi:plastocyanin
MTRRIGQSFIAPAALALLVAVVSAPVALAANTAVDIAGFAFSPQAVTVHVGDTVTWTNADAQHHTATADDGSFNTGAINSGSSKSVTLTTAGTFPYHCSIHPSMTATIVVESASAPATDAAIPLTVTGRSGFAGFALLAAALFGACLGVRQITVARRRSSGRG